MGEDRSTDNMLKPKSQNGKEDHAREHTSQGERSSGREDLGTSWISVISGWLAALGAALILGGVLSGLIVVGGSGGSNAQSEIVRLLVTLTAAFLIGGYVAGRMASRFGLKHGLLVALVSLVVTAVLGLVGLAVGISLVDNLNGVTLPKRQDAQQSLQALLSPSGALVLILPFIGGAFGGAWGAKTGRERP